MNDPPVDGVEHAIFGDVTRSYVDHWLDLFIRRQLALPVREVFVRSGRVTAVYGLLLGDGSMVAAKIHRSPVSLDRLKVTADCQRSLSAAGFPCPAPRSDPAFWDSRVVTLEKWLDSGDRADARLASVRRGMARGLAHQVQILRAVSAGQLAADRPAWTRYEDGPWPAPHDPYFDFTVTPADYQWLDGLAGQASAVLRAAPQPLVTGHGDWVCQNIRFCDGEVAAAFDWDSLIGAPEAVIAGLSAGAYTEGGTGDASAPSPDEVALFLADYDARRATRFTPSEQAVAAAAATWVIAYNARCELSVMRQGLSPDAGSPLRVLERNRDGYMRLRW